MKLTKTLLAAAALVAFAVPTSASAQVVLGDVVGEISGVAGDIVVLRNGNYLQAQNGSALMANDMVFARDGAGTISLTGCNGKFQPCQGAISSGMKVNIGTGDVCSNLGNLIPIGARDAVFAAGQQVVATGGSAVGGLGGGAAGGGILGGGAAGGLPLAAIGAVIAGGALIAVIAGGDDDDDDSSSN